MKIILAHRNTDITTLEPDTDNELIEWIVLEKANGEKVHYFPRKVSD